MSSGPTIRKHYHYARSVGAASSLRADMIFGRDRLVFLTNNFAQPALTIAKLYKCRWQVELFFKWIKQHLRMKAFFATSENAVKSRIGIVVSVCVRPE